MSFPASLTTRVFQGGFVTYPDGAPAKGSVRIVLTAAMQGPADNLFVAPFDITIPLDAYGRFSVVLPATNDPQWTPSTYKVTVTTGGDPLRRRPLLTLGNMPAPAIMRTTLQVPYNGVGPINAADVFNIPAPTPGVSYIVLASKGVAGGVATLGSDGKVPAGQLPDVFAGAVSWLDLIDKPATFPHDPISFSEITGKPSTYPTAPPAWTDVTGKPSTYPTTPPAWTDVTGKPTTFTPATHGHVTSEVTGLDTALAAKANASDVTTALAGKANTSHTHSQSDVSGLVSALTAKADQSSVTSALATKADSSALSTKADLVGGVIPTSQIPAISKIDFLGSVSTQAAMLALVGQSGDWCIRTDIGQTWVITGSTPSQLSSWTAMPLGVVPVQTVNGQVGAVVLGKTDIGLSDVDNTSDVNKPVSTAQQTALNLKAPIASPTFTGTVSGVTAAMVGLGSVNNTSDSAKPVSNAQQTALDLKANVASPMLTGTPVAPTATAGASTTQIATTAFATTADNLRALGAASSVDGGIALFSGTGGKTLKTTSAGIDSNGDLSGIRRLTRTLGSDPAVTGLDRVDLNYAVSTTTSDLERIYVNGVLATWRNEVGFLRGTPHSGYKDDALVRAVPRSDLTSETGGFVELQNSARTQVLYKRDWLTGALWRGNGSAAAVKMADVLVLSAAAAVPSGTPAGTVIVRTAT